MKKSELIKALKDIEEDTDVVIGGDVKIISVDESTGITEQTLRGVISVCYDPVFSRVSIIAENVQRRSEL